MLRETSHVDSALRAIGGCEGGDLYAAGDQGRVLRRVGEGTWRLLAHTGDEAWTGVACDHERVAFSGVHGSVLLVSGDHSVTLPAESDRPWYAIAGGTERTWMVGGGGRLAALDDARIRLLTAGPTGAIRAVASLAGALVGVGEYGRIIREHEDGFAEGASPTAAGLAEVLAIAPDTLVAVGDDGAVVRINADGAELQRSSTHAALRSLVHDGPQLLVVGASGTLLRGTVDALVATRVEGEPDLWSVAGTPADAIAVGDDGAVLRVHAADTGHVDCAPAHGRSLRAVLRGEDGVAWAVGDGGIVVRIDAHGCTVEHDGGATLHAIELGVHGTPFAVGDGGAAHERDAHGHWVDGALDVAGQSLRGISRVDGQLVVVGTGGVILRHILLDGS